MTIQLSEKYPKLIRDFFLYENSTSSGRAHNPVDLPFKYDTESLRQEAETLPWQQVDRQGRVKNATRVFLYGPADGTDTLGMKNTGAGASKKQMDMSKFPLLDQLIDNLNGVGYLSFLSIQKLTPGAYLLPHVDSQAVSHKIYLPLNWPKGCYFKYYREGFVPFDDLRPRILNVGENVHVAINDSDQERTIISIYVDWDTGQWPEIFAKTMKC